jgi:hypothetical protein
MATKSGVLHRIASKTMDAGLEHVGKALKGEETLPEAPGAVVEDLLSGSKAKSSSSKTSRNALKARSSAEKKKPAMKTGSARTKSRAS